MPAAGDSAKSSEASPAFGESPAPARGRSGFSAGSPAERLCAGRTEITGTNTRAPWSFRRRSISRTFPKDCRSLFSHICPIACSSGSLPCTAAGCCVKARCTALSHPAFAAGFFSRSAFFSAILPANIRTVFRMSSGRRSPHARISSSGIPKKASATAAATAAVSARPVPYDTARRTASSKSPACRKAVTAARTHSCGPGEPPARRISSRISFSSGKTYPNSLPIYVEINPFVQPWTARNTAVATASAACTEARPRWVSCAWRLARWRIICRSSWNIHATGTARTAAPASSVSKARASSLKSQILRSIGYPARGYACPKRRSAAVSSARYASSNAFRPARCFPERISGSFFSNCKSPSSMAAVRTVLSENVSPACGCPLPAPFRSAFPVRGCPPSAVPGSGMLLSVRSSRSFSQGNPTRSPKIAPYISVSPSPDACSPGVSKQ